MLGDRTSSYNGFLRFKVWNEDNRRGIHGIRPDQQHFRYFPQAIIVGNNRIELEHIPFEINDDGIYKIRIHESEWRARHSPELALTRKQLMIALQNVQGIYIRGSYNYPARGDAINLQEVSLDVAASESAVSSPAAAIGVEQCAACPQGYTGMSCQDPAEGYCRKRHRDYLNLADDLALIGWSEACACHGHSETCNPDTCACLDCEHNTFGDFCEHCLPGYIGDAREGGSNACTKCACPLVDNSFSDSCVAVDYGRGYVCNACKPGYTGQYCESCIAGYFGDPQHVGGFCAPCDCHPDGSLHGACNPLTGQCECKPGVTGRDCSRCQERHAFINRVCTSCDQGCYLPLMLTVDQLEETLATQNFSNLRPIPWKRVWRIGNESAAIASFVASIERDGGELVADSKWSKEAIGVLDEVNFQAGRSNKSAISIRQFTSLAEQLILDAQIFYANAFNTTNFLKVFATQGVTTIGGSALDMMLMESEAHLNATLDRGEYIAKRLDRAESEHKKSAELLRSVFANKLNETIFDELRDRVETFAQWLDDYRATIYDVAKRDTADAQRMSQVVAKRIDRYKEVANEIEKIRVDAEDNLATARNLVEKAKAEDLMNMVEDREKINSTLADLPDLMEECKNITVSYSELIDEYDEELVQPASKHCDELDKTAKAIGDSFAHTRLVAENPIKASHAYEEIIEALRNATRAANDAVANSQSALAMLGSRDADSEGSLLRELATIYNQSEAIAGESRIALESWQEEGLEKSKDELVERLNFVNEQKIDMVKRLGVIKNEASSWDDKHDRMHSVLTNGARTAHERATNVKKEAELIKEEVAAISSEADKLMNSTSSGVREDVEKIRAVRRQLEYDRQKLSKVDVATQANQERARDIAQSIALLKDKIEQAKEKANQIRLALNSGERGLCRRSFISPARPSPVNQFHVTYRPLQQVADSAVLVTKTKSRRTQSSEYLAVEIRDKRVIAHWDVGVGKRMVTNSHPINYIPSNDRITWYHIDVVRTGNIVNLTVALKENVDGGYRARGTPVSVFVGENASPTDDVIFNTIPGETTLDVGTDNETSAEIGLATNKFHGIVGQLRIDDVALPLWAFDSSTSECEGANAPPRIAERGYLFRDGFANVTMAVSERTMSAITVIFNSYSANGLLYFRGSEQSGDFVVLYLKDGRVVFKINLGGNSIAELTSQNIYNDGREHTVKAIRTGSEMYLQVDSDADRFNTVIPGENTALNIENENHYVAGVPATLDRSPYSKQQIQWNGFIGCILMVKPSQVGELDLEHPEHSQRREEGCQFTRETFVPSDRVIGFARPGFFITKGISLGNRSTLAFSFKSREENGTLLYQSSKLAKGKEDEEGFLAFYLFRGFLVLHFGKDATSRKQVVTFRSVTPYNDGQTHSVYMSREGAAIRLKVDDKEIGETQTLADQSAISSEIMVIGGFGEQLKPPNNEIPSTTPFIGCVSDLFVNMQRVELIPKEHDAAQIGMCSLEAPSNLAPAPVNDPIGGEASSHRKISKIHHSPPSQASQRNFYEVDEKTSERAMRFGISKSSHSRVNFDSPYPNVTSLTIALSLKTDQSNGIVWAWANYKNFTRYIFFNIIDGFATLEVKGHKQPKILKHLGRRVNDRQWHDVLIEKRDKILRLKIDDLPFVEMPDCPTPKVMRRRLYVGGLISKHRSQFSIATPGFNGCIRDFSLNDRSYVLGDVATSRDVVPCAAKPSKGMYVHHGGYATFDSLQKQTRDGKIEISMEFRPTVEEGLLLALAANQNLDSARLTIEIRKEQVMVTLIHSASNLEVRDALPALRSFSDSTWHSIQLRIEQRLLSIELDGEHHELPLIGYTDAAHEHLSNLPLNIGGISAQLAEKLGTASLTGCYRALHLSGRPKFFENAAKLNKVLIDACPME